MERMIIDRWVEDRRAAIACLTLALLIGALCLGGAQLTELLRYDRAAIDSGQLWRLISGHLVHAGVVHALLNMAGIALIALLFPEPLPLWAWAWRVLIISCGISALIYWQLPQLEWYVGLSGTLHGLFVLGFWWLYRQGDRLSLLLLAALIAKLAWEHFMGPISSNEALVGVPVLTQAHSYGAACAVLYLFLRAAGRYALAALWIRKGN